MTRTTEEMAALVKQLREAGATRIEVRPDGTVAAEFGATIPVLQPIPVYPSLPPYPGVPWWGIEQPYAWPPNVWCGDLTSESASSLSTGGLDASH